MKLDLTPLDYGKLYNEYIDELKELTRIYRNISYKKYQALLAATLVLEAKVEECGFIIQQDE